MPGKPDDIPQDVWDAGEDHLRRYSYLLSSTEIVACYPAPIEHEKELHDEFEHLRLCGEWFRPGKELLTHLRLIGCDVDAFTNVVPAHFYRQFPERMQ